MRGRRRWFGDCLSGLPLAPGRSRPGIRRSTGRRGHRGHGTIRAKTTYGRFRGELMDLKCVLVAGTLVLTGCALEIAGPSQSDFRTIERDDTEALRVNLNM